MKKVVSTVNFRMEIQVMSKVVKFGGSSLASAEQFQKAGAIIHAEEERRYVVPSAPGKRYAKDTKVTDMLYGCYALAVEEKPFETELMQIKARYDEIICGLDFRKDCWITSLKRFAGNFRRWQVPIMQHPVENI